MKKALKNIAVSEKTLEKSRLKGFFAQRLDKLKHGPITCPFCREVFNGLAEMGTHIKDHCR